MPQDIPLEASETLVFTPESLRQIEGAPTFTLRAATTREKRFHQRLHAEEGVHSHSMETIRAEVLRGLKALWDEEAFAEHSPVIEAYWDASDQHAGELRAWEKQYPTEAERLANAAPTFAHDPEIEQGVRELTQKVAQEWRPLRVMLADNAEFGNLSLPLMAAVAVKSWTGLPTVRRMDRGYLTVDCAAALAEDVAAFEAKNGLPEGTAWIELAAACTRRMYLAEEEAGNSASQSPSETPPASSTTAAKDPGPSPASTKRSRATRKAA